MKAVRLCLLAFLAVLILGAIGSIWVLRPAQASIVEVLQDGEVIYSFDLSKQRTGERIEIACDVGVNILYVGSEGICVESADCPDQTCVGMGYLKSASLPIVCLPHKLTIRFVDAATDIDIVAA